jgi:hypothetical protein
MRKQNRVLLVVAMVGLPLVHPDAGPGFMTATAAVAAEAPQQSVVISSDAFVARRDGGGLDSPSSGRWCGGDDPVSCEERHRLQPEMGFQPEPESQQHWAVAEIGRDENGVLLLAPNGWGVDPVPPTRIAIGATFVIAQSWHWNGLSLGDFVSRMGIHGSLLIEPPGLPPFSFPLTDPDPDGTPIARILIHNHDTPNGRTCDPGIQRSSIPCDDLRVIEVGRYDEVANGVTWHLDVLGWADPETGETTPRLVLPESDCNSTDLSVCNRAVRPVTTPILGVLTVDTSATTISVASDSPTAPAGSPVIFSAAVTPAPSSGSVQFSDGGSPIPGCEAQPVHATDGTATCTTPSMRPGDHSVTASYAGAIGFASSSSQPFTQVVEGYPTAAALSSSSESSVAGDAVTYTATVTSAGGVPTGSVEFSDGGAPIVGCESQPLEDGAAQCSVTYPVGGGHSLAATYHGDGAFASSTSPALLHEVSWPTTTAVRSSTNPSEPGQTVTYTARIDPAPPGGTASFADGQDAINGCQAVAVSAAGEASCLVTYSEAGAHVIVATFSGTETFAGSSSAPLTQTVDRTLTMLVAEPPRAAGLFRVRMSAHLTVARTSEPIEGQAVTFRATATGAHLCTATTDVAGTATCEDGGLSRLTVLLVGATASFGGTERYGPATDRSGG